MTNYHQPANPTTPENYGYPPDSDTRRYSTTGLTQLQVIASQQLASLTLAYYSTDWSPAVIDEEFTPDADGDWARADEGHWYCLSSTQETTGGRARYSRKIKTLEEKLACLAVRQAKALLDITAD